MQALIDIFPDFGNSGEDEDLLKMYKPSGTTGSAEVAKCAAALEETRSIYRDLCLEGAEAVLDILNDGAPSRRSAKLSSVHLDHPDRVDPRWIVCIMEYLASAEPSTVMKHSPVKEYRERVPPAKHDTCVKQPRWIPGGAGFASRTIDVFRVSLLYCFASTCGLPRGTCERRVPRGACERRALAIFK